MRKITDENSLLVALRNTMQRAIQAQQYEDAIFYADKVLHLITSKNEGEFSQAVYDLANCYLLNKENLRCIELLDKY